MFHWHLYSYSDSHSPQNNTEIFPSLHEKECIYQTMLSHTGLCEEVQLETCGSNSPPYPKKGQIPHSFRTGIGQMLGCVPQD